MPSMIHQEANIAFLHLSKTGGWYVTAILKELGFSVIDMSLNGGHVGAFDIPAGIYKFGFVRHPVSWYTSLYNYLCDVDWNGCAEIKSNSLDELIIKTHDTGWNYNELYLQFYGIGTYLQCNYIGKYESLESDLRHVIYKFGHLLNKDEGDINIIFDKYKDYKVNQSSKRDGVSISNNVLDYIYGNCHDIFKMYNYK